MTSTRDRVPHVHSRRDFLKLGAASAFSLVCVPRSLFAQESERRAPCVLRVAVMSDVHFKNSETVQEVGRFRRAIQFSYDYAATRPYDRLDALMIVGDMTDHGNDTQLTHFKNAMDDELREGTEKLLCMGNHEFGSGSQEFWSEKLGVEPNARYEINGFQFIGISPEKGTMRPGDYLYAVEWLERELSEAVAADPEKPVFVFQHYPVSPTVYGGRGADDWGMEDLLETLQRYPTVVNFSGHTHYPLSDPRVAWQGNFTAFGTSTLSYICHGGEGGRFEEYPAGSGGYAEFYIMEVYADNSVALMPCDVVKNSFYDFIYYVAKPGDVDSYKYTDARYFTSEKPRWRDSTELKVLDVTEYGADVLIPQATCPDVVHSYRFDLEERDSDGNWVAIPPQYFRSLYYDHPMPESIVAELDLLEPQTEYRANVYAFNPFERRSDRALQVSFTTASDSVDHSAPRPDANVIDLRVVDGKLVNQPIGVDDPTPVEIRGDVKLVDAPELGATVASFDATPDVFAKVPCSEEDYRRLRRATIAARFRADGTRRNGTGAVFGNTEMRGIELCVNYEKRVLEFWASVANRSYTIASAPIEFDRWINAFGVFDGRTQILYIDGKEVARVDVVGHLTHPTREDVRAFTFGCDIASQGNGSDFFSGQIERARLYSWALKPEQVEAWSQD